MSRPTPPENRDRWGEVPDRVTPAAGGILSIKLWQLLTLVFGVAIVFWSFTVIGAGAILLVILALVGFVVAKSVVAIRTRTSQRYSLLWMLAIAAEHHMPLATTVDAFADQYRGRFRLRVQRLAALLRQGVGLSHALRSIGGLASQESMMLVEIGEVAGNLPPALRKAAAIQSSRAEIRTMLASQVSYLMIVFLLVQSICGFLLYFIAPKFEAIFMDFGMPLPETTYFIFRTGGALTRYMVPVWLPLLTLLLMFSVQRTLTGGLGFELPWIGAWFPRRHQTRILRSLAMTAGADHPIERGIHTLAERYPTRWVRRRLIRVEKDVRLGIDWRDALTRHGLMRKVDREALIAAGTAGNLAWAMNDLADAADRRTDLRLEILARSLWPIAILAFGGLILLIALGFFAPLVELIGRLSG